MVEEARLQSLEAFLRTLSLLQHRGWGLGAGVWGTVSFMTNNPIMENDSFLSCSTRGGRKTLYDVAKNSSCRHSPRKWVKYIVYGTLKAGLSSHHLLVCHQPANTGAVLTTRSSSLM